MTSAVPGRSDQPVAIHLSEAGKAKILRFDCHHGVVLVDKVGPSSKIRPLRALVRKLLNLLMPLGPTPPMKHERVRKFRIKGK